MLLPALHAAAAAAALPAGEEEFFYLVDGSFRWQPVRGEIPDSTTACLTPARIRDGQVAFLSDEDLAAFAGEGMDFEAAAARNAGRLLRDTGPQLLRDENGILVAAVIETEIPAAGSLPLAPGFHGQFEDMFGPEFLVAIPSRFKIYIFPKLATRMEAFAHVILSEYRVAGQRVSEEVFEVSADGLRAVGRYDDR